RSIQAVFFKPTCLVSCHGDGQDRVDRIDNHVARLAPDGRHWVKTEPGDLAGAVVVSLPMEPTTEAINRNRATLITFAMVTAVLAMMASNIALRFMIARPIDRPRALSDRT